MPRLQRLTTTALLASGALLLGGCPKKEETPKPVVGQVQDEAMSVGRSAADLPGSADDYLRDMDKGLTPEEVHAKMTAIGANFSQDEAWARYNRGRNNWAVWTGGNDRFWDELSTLAFGSIDLLKTVSSHPSITYEKAGKEYPIGRDNRWSWFGLINEPCFSKPTGPDPDRYGLWLDVRDGDCPPDPFANPVEYPGVEIGARGKNIPVGSYYGEPSGVFGLRLFPNPKFDEKAEAAWDADRYYNDPTYYNRKDLVRPYRVGMTCGFCHVGPDPSNPPADFENPQFANLNNNPGAQYFWIDRIFFWNEDKSSFAWQLFHTSEPGALDTSFVSSDGINNPRTMNAVYDIRGRLASASQWGREELAEGGSGNNKQFNDYPETSFLSAFFQPPLTVLAPHVLKDGADSVGILGALNRVYLNIGLFSEEWLLHFMPLTGGGPTSPIEISVARKNSAMWNANETQTQDVALFFAVSATPDKLADAPGGAAYLPDEATETQGKRVFAARCARCHSSKIPEVPAEVDVHDWNEYWAWTKTEGFREAMTEMVLADDFLEGNFLSTEKRIPVTLLGTNACSPLAENGLAGNIWDNFSSQTYKELPAVGTYQVQHPITGEWRDLEMPGGGRGYTRPASLISLWSTAPFALNNAVGKFRYEGTVEARMDSFDDSIRQWLWPETRKTDVDRVRELGLPESIAQPALEGYIYRTTEKSWLKVPLGYLPELFSKPPVSTIIEGLVDDGFLTIGPIPAGTPVNLIANLRVLSEDRSVPARLDQAKKLATALVKIVKALKTLDTDASDEEARAAYADVVEDLIDLSKCPDYVVNRGHYFGTDKLPASEGEPGLSDADKEALIGYLKTL
jgi:cytochrome c5